MTGKSNARAGIRSKEERGEDRAVGKEPALKRLAVIKRKERGDDIGVVVKLRSNSKILESCRIDLLAHELLGNIVTRNEKRLAIRPRRGLDG